MSQQRGRSCEADQRALAGTEGYPALDGLTVVVPVGGDGDGPGHTLDGGRVRPEVEDGGEPVPRVHTQVSGGEGRDR